MANEKHLEILKKGVEAWNEWRKENPDERPDLSGANLRKADFFEANLRGADLSGADLWRANFFGADLRGADFRRADLSEAKHLTIDQLSKVETLYEAKLDPDLEKKIKEKYPHLLEVPKEEEEEK